MGTVSVSIPDDLKERMGKLDQINWSAVARKAFEEQVNEIELIRSIARKSKLTPKDAREIADKINKKASERFMKMLDADRR